MIIKFFACLECELCFLVVIRVVSVGRFLLWSYIFCFRWGWGGVFFILGCWDSWFFICFEMMIKLRGIGYFVFWSRFL